MGQETQRRKCSWLSQSCQASLTGLKSLPSVNNWEYYTHGFEELSLHLAGPPANICNAPATKPYCLPLRLVPIAMV